MSNYFIDKQFDNEYPLGILELLNQGDLFFIREIWNIDSYEFEDATEAESEIYEK
jgi:hypothetical protein